MDYQISGPTSHTIYDFSIHRYSKYISAKGCWVPVDLWESKSPFQHSHDPSPSSASSSPSMGRYGVNNGPPMPLQKPFAIPTDEHGYGHGHELQRTISIRRFPNGLTGPMEPMLLGTRHRSDSSLGGFDGPLHTTCTVKCGSCCCCCWK
jgi:hypothetical protein